MIAVPIALLNSAADEYNKEQNEKYNAEFKMLGVETGLSEYKYTDEYQSLVSLNYVTPSTGNMLAVYQVKATNLGTSSISPYYSDFRLTDNTNGLTYNPMYESGTCTKWKTGYDWTSMSVTQNGTVTVYLIFDVPTGHTFTLGFSDSVYNYEHWKWVE